MHFTTQYTPLPPPPPPRPPPPSPLPPPPPSTFLPLLLNIQPSMHFFPPVSSPTQLAVATLRFPRIVSVSPLTHPDSPCLISPPSGAAPPLLPSLLTRRTGPSPPLPVPNPVIHSP
ncbi:hypothetical protein E2C01_087000 [Portunus trituberculatus]|uniref:Uncharacterized protein n=1 Tax=Portunus trituberculatus TaxID=210409 RepID=A0A5B7JHW7_PORTR|nr:hypothetical protein [Portunus trituberculatus]